MLILSRKTNQKILIGDNIELTIIDIRGDQVKIGVDAPASVKVFREEIYQEIQNENKAALVRDAKLNLPELHIKKNN
ncbi:carbon storage regulator CsrA [Treponema putidum]|uniref:Translational regulator CsrA n=1 Tax=Treponema putidum TaxID=221027 RepID=A0AAE9MRY9_9SPIR|nr:carbon storage regulator CsrA [Treponema putidum]AIN92730.1 carbon storage regulator [Treponema putidum]TWI75264.1 carbon storage regulator CsrA [Treponema putidum]UTY28969.1 carbon storage regulator [Treponema putidum]UTY31381.1 carbon storage regulator [Treponema putidum]UTY33820.1 carbon storage regulator [Treponema putidum]